MALIGCNEPLDLGASSGWLDIPEETASDGEPQTIYENDRRHVFGLGLEGTTLYALVEHNAGFQLVACPVDRCRSERRVLYQGPKLANEHAVALPFVIGREHVAWTVTYPYRSGVASCAKAGCDEVAFVDARGDVGIDSLTGDDEALYWTEETALWRLEWGEPTPQLVRELPQRTTGRLVAHEDFIYYALSDGVYRLRTDGSAEPEQLARDVNIRGLTAGDDALYYSTEMLAGRIARCPWGAAGCDESAVVERQRFPSTVRQASGELYWVNFLAFGTLTAKGSLLSCELPGCIAVRERARDLPPPVGESLGARVPLAMSDRFAVWIEKRGGHNGSSETGSALRSIAR